MRIAVDGRILLTNVLSDCHTFAQKVIVNLARRYSEHQFVFLLDNNINPLINLPENATRVIITPKPTNVLLYKWWYDVKVPLALKKCKADIFIGAHGICSLTTAIPQLLIIHNLEFLHKSVSLIKNDLFFYKNFTSRFLAKATLIATFSDFIKQEIISTYSIAEQKITFISSVADSSFKPLNWEEREKVKERYAQGCEYFIFTAGLNPQKNIINLLRSFSIFKKWQKTNMKLVITGDINKYKNQAEKLNSYKYKKEIQLVEKVSDEELAQLTAGAYAMIFPSFYEGFGLPVLNAIQCEVPVITSVNSAMSEIAGDGALYADPAKPEEIAEQMKRIFKDEHLRNTLIVAGKERIQHFSWNKTIALACQAVEKTVSK